MSGFIGALGNPFVPPIQNIALGANGTVLTMVAGIPKFVAASGGGGIGTYLSYASPAGVTPLASPTGFGAGVGRLDVDTSAGAATWTALIAGNDAQLLIISVIGANALTLGSGFRGGVTLLDGDSVLTCYYGGAVTLWVVV